MRNSNFKLFIPYLTSGMLDTIKMIRRASNAFNWEQAFFNTTLKEKVDSFSKTL